MHEMAIAQSIMDIVQEEISRRGIERLETINLVVGMMSAVIPQHLAFCFEIVTKDTPLEGTALRIREVPLTYYCTACTQEFTAEEVTFVCPDCGKGKLELIAGRELAVESLEVSD